MMGLLKSLFTKICVIGGSPCRSLLLYTCMLFLSSMNSDYLSDGYESSNASMKGFSMKTSGNSSAKGQNLDPCSSSISCEELMLRDMSSKDSYKNSRAKSTSSMYGGKG